MRACFKAVKEAKGGSKLVNAARLAIVKRHFDMFAELPAAKRRSAAAQMSRTYAASATTAAFQPRCAGVVEAAADHRDVPPLGVGAQLEGRGAPHLGDVHCGQAAAGIVRQPKWDPFDTELCSSLTKITT